jgi:hypothetical protein
MKTKLFFIALTLLALLTLNSQLSFVHAQGTAFTYQGRLNSGAGPATGNYDLTFTLFNVSSGGSAVAGPLATNSVAVSNGLFTIALDFGHGVFNGADYWLEIGVRTNGGGTFTTLMPRQPVTPTPYAIFAENVTAAGISGTIPAADVSGTYGNAVNFNNGADSFDGSFYGQFFGSTFTGGTFTGAFVGTGSGLGDVWHTGGNSGTTAGVNFVGTTDNQPLELHVNGQRVLRLTPDNSTNKSPDIIGGSPVNLIAPGIIGSTISGGGVAIYGGQPGTNQILGDFNTIGGGWGNTTGSTNFDVVQATVGGGAGNTASGISSTIGGGAENVAYNNDAAIAGGFQNRAGLRSAIAGGELNAADGAYSGIGGGYGNNVQTNTLVSTIGGGIFNTVQGTNLEGGATIGGGGDNTIQPSSVIDGNNPFTGYPSSFSTIGGGFLNQIQSNSVYSTIGGGLGNTIQSGGAHDFIGGGVYNTILPGAHESTIAGGSSDTIGTNDINAFIGGGWQNLIQNNGVYATIGGGWFNVIQHNGQYAAIGGGLFNLNNAANGVIAGGQGNMLGDNAIWGAIGGGLDNSNLAANATISGGSYNLISANASGATISGGQNNTVGGIGGAVVGGTNNAANGYDSFAAGTSAQATNNGSFVLTDASSVTNFSSSMSNQLSARFTGGIVFVTAGAGITLDGQPILGGSNGTSLTNVNAATLNGLSSGAFAPASGSANYIQNQTAAPQAASFNIGGTATASALVVSNNAQVVGLFRSGSETGTSQGPGPAGLVIRRINSLSAVAGQVVARSDLLILQRDGSNGGLQIIYPASPGYQTIAAMGMDNNGNQVNFYTAIASPSTAGTIQIYSNAQNVHSCQITFGNTFNSGHVTQVNISRYLNDYYWVGTVTSTYNQ